MYGRAEFPVRCKMEDMRNTQSNVVKTQLNPWTWQDRLGFSQAWKVEGAGTLIFVSGQCAFSADGQLVGGTPPDFEAQVRQTFENMKTVLARGGASLDSIVKLTVFLTDISQLREYGRIKAEYIKGEQPASSAIGVTSLAMPGMMIEIEATAVV
jgi:2-iminobutanoate/2-iminopropanoate deaminase